LNFGVERLQTRNQDRRELSANFSFFPNTQAASGPWASNSACTLPFLIPSFR
jgi:hypothetical protein